jgi:hypothetical protein
MFAYLMWRIFKTNWAKTGILIDWVLEWLNLWWCEPVLWHNDGGYVLFSIEIKRTKKKKQGRGVFWNVITWILLTKLSMEISNDYFL